MFSGKGHKSEKDPKKLLENLKLQQEKINQLEETEDSGKAKEIKEKMAWKTILQKAEGQKVKDDPILLKKTIKKMVSNINRKIANHKAFFFYVMS